MDEDVIGGRASLVAGDGERRNFHRSARAPPATTDTPDTSPDVTTSQVTASLHDFAVSLGLEATVDAFHCADEDDEPVRFSYGFAGNYPGVQSRTAECCGCRKPLSPGHMPSGTRPVSVQRSASAGPVLVRPEVG